MRLFALGAMLLLAGCVSTQMRGFVGQDITEAYMRYGQPVNVLELPDGRRAYQFQYGAGTALVPGASRSDVSVWGNTATVNTVATPAAAVYDDGCLLTFIASPSGNSWTVTDIRVPQELVC